MPHSNRMKISAEAYADLKNDLRDLIASVRERGDPMEKALIARQIEDVQIKGWVSNLFQQVWLNTDMDDNHPRFHDGEIEVIDKETGKTSRAIRFAAIRHLPFKGEDNRWVHRLQARPDAGGEDLTDDQIATAIREIVRDLGAENALDTGALLGARPSAQPAPATPAPDTLVKVIYDFDTDDDDAEPGPESAPLLGELPFHMDGNEAHYRFPLTKGVTQQTVEDDLEHNSPWSHMGFSIETEGVAVPAPKASKAELRMLEYDLRQDVISYAASVTASGTEFEKALLKRLTSTPDQGQALLHHVRMNTDFDDANPYFQPGQVAVDVAGGEIGDAVKAEFKRHLAFKPVEGENRMGHWSKRFAAAGLDDTEVSEIMADIMENMGERVAEKAIAVNLIDTGLGMGLTVRLMDEEGTLLDTTRDRHAILQDIDATELVTVRFTGPGPDKKRAAFMLVWGNGEDLISDSTMNDLTDEIERRARRRAQGGSEAQAEPQTQQEWMAEAQRRDDAWQAILEERFGDEAGEARYEKRGRGEFDEPLGEAFLRRQFAMLRAFPEGVPPSAGPEPSTEPGGTVPAASAPANPAHGRFIFTGESMAYGMDDDGPSQTVWRIRATASFGRAERGEIGGWIADADCLDADGWAAREAIVLAGSKVGGSAWVSAGKFGDTVLDASVVQDGAEVTDTIVRDSTVQGSARLDNSTIHKAVISDQARVEKSNIERSNLTGASSAHSSIITASLIEDSEVSTSTVDRTYASHSTIAASVMKADVTTDQGFRVRDSKLYDATIFPVITPYRTADLRFERTRLSSVDVRGQDCIGVTLDGSGLDRRLVVNNLLSPRAANAWLICREQQADDGMLTDQHPFIFLPDLPTERPANEDILRSILIAAVRAKDPEITRYLDTLAAQDKDYGVVEAIMADSRLRMGLTDALRQIPATVMGERFIREPEDSRLGRSMAELDIRLLDAHVHMSQLPAIRAPLRLFRDSTPRPIPSGQTEFNGVPIILMHGTDADDARPCFYEPAFIETGLPDADFSTVTIRTFTADGDTAPRVAFASEGDAHQFISDYLVRGEDAVWEATGDPLPNIAAPILTGFDVDTATQKATFLLKAAPPNDFESRHLLGRHEGYQAAIINLGAFQSGEATLHPSALDGALATASAALRVAEARASRGVGWEDRRPDPEAKAEPQPQAPSRARDTGLTR